MAKQTNRDFKLLLYFVSLSAQLIFESAEIKPPVEIVSAEADAEELFMQVYSRTFRNNPVHIGGAGRLDLAGALRVSGLAKPFGTPSPGKRKASTDERSKLSGTNGKHRSRGSTASNSFNSSDVFSPYAPQGQQLQSKKALCYHRKTSSFAGDKRVSSQPDEGAGGDKRFSMIFGSSKRHVAKRKAVAISEMMSGRESAANVGKSKTKFERGIDGVGAIKM